MKPSSSLVTRCALGWSLALLAALTGAAQDEPVRHEYPFHRDSDLDDFETLEGNWGIYASRLTCSSRGARDEIRWRRGLGREGSVEVQFVRGARAFLSLTSDSGTVDLQLKRSDRTIKATWNGNELRTAHYDGSLRDAIRMRVVYAAGLLRVQVAAEDPIPLPVDGWSTTKLRLSLGCQRGQSSFDQLIVQGRPATPGETPPKNQPDQQGDGQKPLPENDRLRLEDARAALKKGAADDALELIRGILPPSIPRNAREVLHPAVLLLLNQIALRDSRLCKRSPLAELLEQTATKSDNEELQLHLPFRPHWTVETPRMAGRDGTAYLLTCSSPAITIEVFRYDPRFHYWFGTEPRVHSVGGSSTGGLAKARFTEQVDQRERIVTRQKPEKGSLRVGGETATWYEISWLGPITDEEKEGGAEPDPQLFRELFASHRGTTQRISVEGSVEAVAAAQDELTWILDSLRFLNP